MRTKLCSLCLVFAVGFMAMTIPLMTVAAETIQRMVRGRVMASNTAVDPQTIVVKVVLLNKKELIVGLVSQLTPRLREARELPDWPTLLLRLKSP